jgi:hypothetical protein
MRKIIIVSVITVNVIAIALYNYYSIFLNETNHTSFTVLEICSPFVFGIVIAIILIGLRYFKKIRHSIVLESILIAVCLIGIVNVAVYEKLNIMMNYDTWAKKGMPEKYETYDKNK